MMRKDLLSKQEVIIKTVELIVVSAIKEKSTKQTKKTKTPCNLSGKVLAIMAMEVFAE